MPKPALSCRLLAGFELSVDGVDVDIRGTRSRQLFAYLALNVNTIVGVERLSNAIWGETPPDSARNSIQRFVSDLRRDLGPARDRLESIGEGYRLELVPGDSFDVHDLEAGLVTARELLGQGQPAQASAAISTPDPRAEPLGGLEGAEFASLEQIRLSSLAADAIELEIQCLLEQGQPDAAVAMAQLLSQRELYRERLCVSLATGLNRMGRANDALQTIQEFRTRLRNDLGLDSSPSIDQAELNILSHPSSGADGAGRQPRPRRRRGGAMFGRDGSVDQVIDALASDTLVSLVGPGGIGKTTLSHAVVDAWHENNQGISRVVPLEGVRPAGLMAAIGQAVGTSASGADTGEEVLDRIHGEVDLLVLDNCEHLIAELGGFLTSLFETRSPVAVLATSRTPLGSPDERVVLVGRLDLGASRAMLMHHAERASVSLDQVDDTALSAVFEELDGLPLAIELAAASLRTIGVPELAQSLRSSGTAPSQAGSRPDRHQSIQRVLEPTLENFEDGVAELLRLASFFTSDFSLAAIERLAGGEAAQRLGVLIDHSLLELDHSALGARYRMLVPIRSAVRERSAPQAVHEADALVAHYVAIAVSALDQMKGTESSSGVARLRGDLTNIASSVDLAFVSHDYASIAQILSSVGLANAMSPAVGATTHLQDWTERVQARLLDPPSDPAIADGLRRALAWGLYGACDGGWYRQWERDAPVDAPEIRAMAAIASFSRGTAADAWCLLEEIDLEAISDPYLRSMLCGVGAVVAFQGGSERGHDLVVAATAAAAERPSHGASFFARVAQSTQAFIQGDGPTSVGLLQGATEVLAGHDLLTLENFARSCLLMTSSVLFEQQSAEPMLIDLFDRYLEQHSLDPASVAMTLDVAVITLDRRGQTSNAAVLLGLIDRLGLSMAILRPLRSEVEDKVAKTPWAGELRARGSTMSTFDVLRETRDALSVELDESASA